jgi:hypothetical protein
VQSVILALPSTSAIQQDWRDHKSVRSTSQRPTGLLLWQHAVWETVPTTSTCRTIAHVTAAPTSIKATLVDASIRFYQKAMLGIADRSVRPRIQLAMGIILVEVCNSVPVTRRSKRLIPISQGNTDTSSASRSSLGWGSLVVVVLSFTCLFV